MWSSPKVPGFGLVPSAPHQPLPLDLNLGLAAVVLCWNHKTIAASPRFQQYEVYSLSNQSPGSLPTVFLCFGFSCLVHHQNFATPPQRPHQHCPIHHMKWAKGTRLLFPRVLQLLSGFLQFLIIAKEMITAAVIAPDRTLAFLFRGTALPLLLFSFFVYEGDLGHVI